MADIETITIFRADTGKAVQSIGDLKSSIKALKKDLEGMTIGSEEYADTLSQLQIQQVALKNAMHATTAAGEDQADTFSATAKAAKGMGTSYNALVKQMADLDQQFRATEDAAERADLGARIKEINEQLKKLDEDRGKFGRNVGDYFGQITEPLKGVIQDLPSGLSKIKSGLDDTTKTLGLMGKQPILGVIALLAPIISKIAEGLKENETALGAIDKLMAALKPVADFFAGILEKIAGWLGSAVDFVLKLASESNLSFSKIIAGAVGVGNTILQFILTPIRTTIEAAKGLGKVFKDIFTGKWKQVGQDAKAALDGIGDAFKKGFDFKSNFAAGQAAGDAFLAGLKSPKTKKDAEGAGKEIAEEVAKGYLAGIDEILKAMEEGNRRMEEEARRAAEDLAEITGIIEDEIAETTETIQAELDAQLSAEYDTMMAERELTRQRINNFVTLASAVGDVATALADIYETDAEADEKSAQKAKGLRVAGAILSTLSGAVSAFMSTWSAEELPYSMKVVLAPTNAAAVLAAGYAQIKKMNATKVGNGSATASASVSAPSFSPAVSQVRTITGASEEERLNRMAADNRVYLVYSDIERANTATRVRVQETEF